MKKMLSLAVIASLVACESVDSTDVLTSGVYADIAATADGSGTTTASAVLRVGGGNSNTFLHIDGDDEVVASQGEDSTAMSEIEFGNYYSYVADFEIDAEDTEFLVGFNRTVDEGAPATSMTLPPLFELSGPEADITVAASDEDITISWDPADSADDMSWSIDGDCIASEGGTVDGDPGIAVIEAGTLEWWDEDEPATCEATITVTRSRAGSLDEGYGEGGTAYGRQQRSVSLLVAP